LITVLSKVKYQLKENINKYILPVIFGENGFLKTKALVGDLQKVGGFHR
jgi:hypothetical protein